MVEETLTTRLGLRRWFWIQLVVQEILLIIGRGFLPTTGSRESVILMKAGLSVCIVFNLLGLVLLSSNEERLSSLHWFKRFLYRFNHYGQAFIQTVTIIVVLGVWTRIFVSSWHVNANIVTGAVLLLLLVAYIPAGIFAYGRVQSLVGRIVIIFVLAFGLVCDSPDLVTGAFQSSLSSVVKSLVTSGVAGAVIFAVMTGFTMVTWSFRLPRFGFSRTSQWWVIAIMALFCVAFMLFNAFDAGTSFSTLWKFDFRMKAPTVNMMLNGLAPGIVEEWMVRFVILGLLMKALQYRQHQFGWAVAISSILFGLFHFSNLIGQSLTATIEQALSAGSLGCLFAALYLYTRALWWPMLFHFGVDSLAFMSSGSQTMSKPGMFDWWITIIESVIFIGLAVFLLTGKRGRNAKRNFREFSGDGLMFTGSLARQTYPTR